MNRKVLLVSAFLLIPMAICDSLAGDAPPTLTQLCAKLKGAKSSPPAEACEVGSKLRDSLGTSDFSPSPIAIDDIGKAREVATFLIESLRKHHADFDATGLAQVAEILGAVLDKYDAAIEEKYVEQPGTANVAPPPGVPNAFPGMNPADIRDEKLRREYQAALDREVANHLKNRQQSELREARMYLLLHIASLESRTGSRALTRDILVEKFAGKGKSKEMLREMMKSVQPRKIR